MRRLYICLAIFFAIVASSWFSLVSLKSATKELEKRAAECIAAYDNDDADIHDKLKELDICWVNYYKKVSFLTRSSSLEELAVSVSRLDDLLENKGGDFKSELNAVIYRAEVLYENQLPLPESVF